METTVGCPDPRIKRITLGEKFTLQLDCTKMNLERITNMLDENKYEYSTVKYSYSSFVEIYVRQVNLRKAEVLRQLLRNLIVT